MSTSIAKPISRQRRWQIAKAAAGKCIICGEKAVKCNLCETHYAANATTARNRYRKMHGISIEAAPYAFRNGKRTINHIEP